MAIVRNLVCRGLKTAKRIQPLNLRHHQGWSTCRANATKSRAPRPRARRTGSSPRHTVPATIRSPRRRSGACRRPGSTPAGPPTPSRRNGSSVTPSARATAGYNAWNAARTTDPCWEAPPSARDRSVRAGRAASHAATVATMLRLQRIGVQRRVAHHWPRSPARTHPPAREAASPSAASAPADVSPLSPAFFTVNGKPAESIFC